MKRVSYIHLTIECLSCDIEFLNSAAKIGDALRDAALICDLHVLKQELHHFTPHGITGYVLLTESHLSIHTWPEQEFALIDVLSCSSINVDALVGYFRASLSAKSVEVSIHSPESTVQIASH